MGQLEPGAAGAQLGAQQEAILQQANDLVGDAAGLFHALVDDAARAGLCDKLAVDPCSQLTLRHRCAGLSQHGRQRVAIEAGERLVHVSDRIQVGVGNRAGRPVLDVLPKLVAHHLQLHRLDVLPRRGALLARHAHLAQVVDQAFGRARGEWPAAQLGRPADRLQGRGDGHPLHVETRAQPVEYQVGVRVQRGHVILAQGQNHPQARVVQERLVQLAKKLRALGPAVRVAGDQLLELIDDQDKARPGCRRCGMGRAGLACGYGRRRIFLSSGCRLGFVGPAPARSSLRVDGGLARQVRQKIAQGDLSQPRGRLAALIEAGHEVERVDAGHLADAGRQIAGDTADRQHLEAILVPQIGDEAGADQRALAGPRLRVEQQQSLRHHARLKVARLALAAKEEPALCLRERARADVGGLERRLRRGHGISSWWA